MPFDTAEVARQIEGSRARVHAEELARADALQMALRIYGEVGEVDWTERVTDSLARRWSGVPLSRLAEMVRHEPCAPDYCVVATDSSFVPPDKHRGALCHLINVGRVMIRYGDDRLAEIDSVPAHYTDALREGEEIMSSRVLGAKCALREMQELYEWARRYGADVALVDGSLMQLPLVLSSDPEVVRLTAEYLSLVDGFRDLGVPVVGYISQPASNMVMRAIRMLGCERPIPCEARPIDPCSCQPLWSIEDSELFWELLGNGERSPIFEPYFANFKGGNAEAFKGLVFSYLATQFEVVRLEYPLWVAEEGLLERATAIILHQSWLGKGYPNSLTLAHQYAVLHNSDREAYYFLLERAGMLRKVTEKARGKRAVGEKI
jgi:hypothetical protein